MRKEIEYKCEHPQCGIKFSVEYDTEIYDDYAYEYVNCPMCGDLCFEVEKEKE